MTSYLAVGHATRDLTPSGPRTGGTAAYSAAVAHALGLDARLLTSMALPPALPAGIESRVVPADTTTTFEYQWIDGHRNEKVTARASTLGANAVPLEWRDSSIWHLGPVIVEIEASVLEVISDHAFVGITPQGWMRTLSADGFVERCAWVDAAAWVGRANAIVLSIEDIEDAMELARQWSEEGVIVAVTKGANGSTIWSDGEPTEIPVFKTPMVDDLGAGDIYAAALFIRLAIGDSIPGAGRYAAAAAALSVQRHGPFDPPSLEDINFMLRVDRASS